MTKTPLGDIDLTNGATTTLSISGKGVPSEAREILVFVTLATGHNHGTNTNVTLTLWTSDGKQDCKKYLHGCVYDQQAWSYNSENMFFPAPSDMKLRASVAYSGSQGSGNRNCSVYLIGFRL